MRYHNLHESLFGVFSQPPKKCLVSLEDSDVLIFLRGKKCDQMDAEEKYIYITLGGESCVFVFLPSGVESWKVYHRGFFI